VVFLEGRLFQSIRAIALIDWIKAGPSKKPLLFDQNNSGFFGGPGQLELYTVLSVILYVASY